MQDYQHKATNGRGMGQGGMDDEFMVVDGLLTAIVR